MATADYFLLIIHSKIVILADTESRDHPMGIWLDFLLLVSIFLFLMKRITERRKKETRERSKKEEDDFDHQS